MPTSFARPPGAEQLSEVSGVDDTVGIQISRDTGIEPPGAQELRQIPRVDSVVTVQIARTRVAQHEGDVE